MKKLNSTEIKAIARQIFTELQDYATKYNTDLAEKQQETIQKSKIFKDLAKAEERVNTLRKQFAELFGVPLTPIYCTNPAIVKNLRSSLRNAKSLNKITVDKITDKIIIEQISCGSLNQLIQEVKSSVKNDL